MQTDDLGASSGGESRDTRPSGRVSAAQRTVLRWGLRGLRAALALLTATDQLGLLDGGVATTLHCVKAVATATTWYVEWLLSRENLD